MKKRDFFFVSILSLFFWAVFIVIFAGLFDGFSLSLIIMPIFIIMTSWWLFIFILFLLFLIVTLKENTLSSSKQQVLLALCFSIVLTALSFLVTQQSRVTLFPFMW